MTDTTVGVPFVDVRTGEVTTRMVDVDLPSTVTITEPDGSQARYVLTLQRSHLDPMAPRLIRYSLHTLDGVTIMGA